MTRGFFAMAGSGHASVAPTPSGLSQTIVYDYAGTFTWQAPPTTASVTVNGSNYTVTPGTTYNLTVGTDVVFNGHTLTGTSASMTYIYNPAVVGGASLGDYEGTLEDMSAPALAAQIALMKADGCTYARIDSPWGGTGTGWEYPADTVAVACVAGGVTPIMILEDWSGGNFDGYWETGTGSFAAACTAVAEHYQALGINTFEIGNEVNLGPYADGGHWVSGTVSPAQYTACIQECYTNIKSVFGASVSTVLMSGLAPYGAPTGDLAPAAFMTQVDFINACYAQGAAGSFDALNMHCYNNSAFGDGETNGGLPNEAEAYNPFQMLPTIYAAMEANGDSAKQIWGTEFGVPVGGQQSGQPTFTQNVQALSLALAWQEWAQYSYCGPFLVYNWYDDDTGDYGLYTSTGVAKTILPIFEAGTVTAASIAGPVGPAGLWTLKWHDEFDDSAGSSGPTHGLLKSKWNSGFNTGPSSPGAPGLQSVVTGAPESADGDYHGPNVITFPGDGSMHLQGIACGTSASPTVNAGLAPDTPPDLPLTTYDAGMVTTAGLMALNPASASIGSAPLLSAITAGSVTVVNGPCVFEVKMRIAGPNQTNADNWWPVIWMSNGGNFNIPSGAGADWPGGVAYLVEQDYWEWYNSPGGTIGGGGSPEYTGATFSMPENPSDNYNGAQAVPTAYSTTDMSLAFHTYTVEFSAADSLTLYVDGITVPGFPLTNSLVEYNQSYPFFLIIALQSHAIGVDYPDTETTVTANPPNTTAEGNNDMMIEYVRVWSAT